MLVARCSENMAALSQDGDKKHMTLGNAVCAASRIAVLEAGLS